MTTVANIDPRSPYANLSNFVNWEMCPDLTKIFYTAQTIGSWTWNASIETVKKEWVAITLIFFSYLGILPGWVGLAMTISGISRLSWIIYSAQTALLSSQQYARQLEGQITQLTIATNELTYAHQLAINERNSSIEQRDALQHDNSRLSIDLNEITQQQEYLEQQLKQALHRDEERAALHQEKQNLNEQNQFLTDQNTTLRKQYEQIQRQSSQISQNLESFATEKEQIQLELDQLKKNQTLTPFQQACIEAEKTRNEHFKRILNVSEELQRNSSPNAQSDLDKAIETLCQFEQSKVDALQTLNQAINTIPPNHISRYPLEQIQTILTIEGQALKNIGHIFSLHSPLERLLNALKNT